MRRRLREKYILHVFVLQAAEYKSKHVGLQSVITPNIISVVMVILSCTSKVQTLLSFDSYKKNKPLGLLFVLM